MKNTLDLDFVKPKFGSLYLFSITSSQYTPYNAVGSSNCKIVTSLFYFRWL